MFAYCGNNPVICVDPDGNTCVMTCSGDINLLVRDLSGFHSAIGGGGGGGGLISEMPKASGTLKDTVNDMWGGTSHGKILPWEFDLFSISNEGFTLIDASVSALEASVEWEYASVTVGRFLTAEASAGITAEDGAHASLMASIASADASISFWIFEVELTGYLGAVGAKASLDVDGISVAIAPGGIGGGLSIKWDLD